MAGIGGYVFISLSASGIGYLDAVHRGVPFGVFNGYFSLPVFLSSICLFIAFPKLVHFSNYSLYTKFIEKVSSATFGIYLMHPFFLEHLDSRGINLMMGNPIYMILLLSVAVFIVCMILTMILQKIPVVKKIV